MTADLLLPVDNQKPRLEAAVTAGQIKLTIHARASPIILQQSSDLVNWATIMTNTVTDSGAITLTESLDSRGFYRALQ
jgi:hypothetical protein